MLRLLLLGVIATTCFMLILFVPGESATIQIVIKFGLFRLIYFGISFSLAIYICVKLSLGNEEWYKEYDVIQDVDEK